MIHWWIATAAIAVIFGLLAHWPNHGVATTTASIENSHEAGSSWSTFDLEAWESRFRKEDRTPEESARETIALVRALSMMPTHALEHLIDATSPEHGEFSGKYARIAFLILKEKDPMRALTHPLADPLQQGSLGNHWSARREAFNQLARANRDEARRWLLKNHAQVGNDLTVMMASVTLDLARHAPHEMADWFTETQSYSVRTEWESMLEGPMHLLRDGDARWRFYEQLCAIGSSELAQQACEELLTATLHMEGFQAGAALVQKLPVGTPGREEAITAMLVEAGQSSPEMAFEWLLTQRSEHHIQRISPEIMLRWASRGDLDAAERQLATLEGSPLFDQVLPSFIRGAAVRDLDRALKWTTRISDPKTRDALEATARFKREQEGF